MFLSWPTTTGNIRPPSPLKKLHRCTYWTSSWVPTSYVLMDNGPNLVGRFITTLCWFLGLMKLTMTANNQQRKGQNVERYSRTVVMRLNYFDFEPQRDWGTYVQTFTYSYSTEIYRDTGIFLLNVTLLRKIPSATTLEGLTGPKSDMPREVAPQ